MGVPEVLRESGARQQGLVTTAQFRAAGVTRSALTRAVAAGTIVRTRTGVYAAAALAACPREVVVGDAPSPAYLARVRDVLLALGPGAAAAGRTAAAVRGWAMLVEPRAVEAAVPHGRSRARVDGVRVRQQRAPLTVEEVEVADGAPITAAAAEQTVLHLAATLPLLEAVVICDSALRSGQVDLDGLTSAVSRLPRGAGALRIRRVLRLSDPLAGSVLESVARVKLVLAGVSGFVTQVALRSGSRRILRVDFCFASARLVLEVDGRRFHPDGARDQDLDNQLAAAGWRVLRFGWTDVVHGDVFVELVKAALGSHDLHQRAAA